MEQKKQIQGLFQSINNAFSHSKSHFAFLIIVGIITGILWWRYNQEVVEPHDLSIGMGWESYEKNPYIINSKQDSLSNVIIHFKFNSNKIKSISEGQYCNGVVVEFDGNGLTRYFSRNNIMEDRILVSMFLNKSLDSYKVIADMGQIEYHSKAMMNSVTESISRIDTIRIINNNFEEKPNQEQYCTEVVSNDTLKAYIKYGGGVKERPLKCYRYKVVLLSDNIGVNDNNPYYYYNISFPFVKFDKELAITFEFSDLQNSNDGLSDIEKTMLFENIYPEPDVKGKGIIKYYSNEKKAAIQRNHGIIIRAVDIEALNHQKKRTFAYSTMVGVGVPLVLELIIQLILKLRRLHRKEE